MEKGADPEKLPPFPEQLRGVWDRYVDLTATRQAGMGPNPISYLEIQAYAELERVELTAWQVRLIRRLDMAQLAGMARTAKRKRDEPATDGPAISVRDTKGVRALLSGIAAAKRIRKEVKHG